MKTLNGSISLYLTTFFERFAFYSLMSILILFFQDTLGNSTERASIIYSSFYAVLSLTPFIMGMLGDFTNRSRMINIGLALLTIGYGSMTLLPGSNPSFLILPLAAIAFGYGAFRPNIIVLLGNLYEKEETKAPIGFILYYTFINIGALLAPIITFQLKQHYGLTSVLYLTAGIMLINFILFQLLKPTYQHANDTAASNRQKPELPSNKKRFNNTVLPLIFLSTLPLYAAYHQNGLTLNFFINDYIIGGYTPEKHAYINPLFVVIFSILISIVLYQTRNKSKLLPIRLVSLGLLIAAISYLLAPLGIALQGNTMNAAWVYIILIPLALSEVFIGPIMSYIAYKSAPIKHKGLIIGLLTLTTSLANMLLFPFAKAYENKGPELTFLIIAAILLIIGTIYFIVSHHLKKLEDQ